MQAVRSPWDLNYQKALIDDIYKRHAASSGRPIALLDYIERDIFADMDDIRLRMGGVDPNSNPSMTALLLFQQTLDKVRVLYRNIIAKLAEQKAASPTTPLISDTPRRHSPAVSPEGDTRSSDAPTDRSHQGFMAIETIPFAETIRRLKGCPSSSRAGALSLGEATRGRHHTGSSRNRGIQGDGGQTLPRIKNVRRQVDRTRDNLDKKDCPLRLVVAANTVRTDQLSAPSQGPADSTK